MAESEMSGNNPGKLLDGVEENRLRAFVDEITTKPWADVDVSAFLSDGPGWLLALLEERARLRAFIVDLFEATVDWPEGGDVDAGEFEELAVHHGLLKSETRTAPCAENCFCAEYHGDMAAGVICYRKVGWLAKAGEPRGIENG